MCGRDFSNGYLVAEILFRYFPSLVQMHSVDTGCGLVARRNNWEMVGRWLVKKNLQDVLGKQMLTDIVDGQHAGCILTLLESLYHRLTGKAVRRAPSIVGESRQLCGDSAVEIDDFSTRTVHSSASQLDAEIFPIDKVSL